ncbi:hypothetical protein DH2020_028904 [Rehmannia glutinosa]|uniref:Serine aminopeptidase S33 domain-containing protein n=1 Tax=Rehmannia glutinosa TaxID=99300 RepID=A0ABR0VTN2_REHGL
MTTNGTWFRLSPMILSHTEYKTCSPVSTRISGNSKLSSNLWANSRESKSCSSRHRVKNRSFSSGSGFLPENKKENLEAKQELKPLWDDGYGTQTVKDYLEAAKVMIKPDGGPPRWFCPIESGPPLQNSPVLLYLPGIDGLGMGLILHHKALGKVFEIRCMHIPVNDRTPYEKLVKFVENAVRAEHASYPNKPIYLVGDSFGACLALSVAASNPEIDLVLILVNPATSFNKSKLQHFLPLLEVLPEKLDTILPYLFGATLGDPIKMANVINTKNLLTSPAKQIESLILELSSLMTGISSLADILPKQTLIWKLKLLKSAAAYSNSRIHSIKHEVLILASGKDSMLPSKHEAQRLSDLLKNCRVRFFKNNGHTLLMEDGTNLLTVLKGTCTYRRSKRRDPVTDFLPPSMSEFQKAFDHLLGWFRAATSPVTFSTLADGKIVRGLKGVPDNGPVLLVGYHMLLGAEIGSVVEEFLREKNVMVYGMAHPEIFTLNMEEHLQEISGFDYFKVFGATPATSSNFFKLLASKSYVLLYPGGIREALHRKGEEYKLFWPDEPEFVRMAARFGAKIVPFGVVGEDDLVKLFLDYDDLMRIPHVKEMIKRRNQNAARVRVGTEMKGEVSKQDFFVPGFYPKMPGRFYFLFGKPMETKGRGDLVKDKIKANEFYLQIKSDVERSMAYLIKKREEDPYRHLLDRLLYRAISAPVHQVPTFDP